MSKTALSVYSGAGGLDLGIAAAGFRIIASVEKDADCCSTLRANGFTDVEEGAVESLDHIEVLNRAKLEIGELDLLFGGPPCQPFSKSAHWAVDGAIGMADERAKTLEKFLALVEALRPKAILVENVPGFSTNGGRAYIEKGLAEINSRIGTKYKPTGKILNTAEFGVPQLRHRYILVALRSGEEFAFPPFTHDVHTKPFATAWDAIANLEMEPEDLSIKGRWAALIPSIPEGKNYLWHTSRGGGQPLFGWRTRYWSFLYKLSRSAPSPTLVASPSQNTGPYHWDNRLLSTKELARLQTFPADYVFEGNRASRQRQIGNAVPPLLAEQLGRALMNAMGERVEGDFRYSIAPKEVMPAPAATGPVSEEYLSLVGDHPDHPGTGMGPKGRKTTPEPAASPLQAAE